MLGFPQTSKFNGFILEPYEDYDCGSVLIFQLVEPLPSQIRNYISVADTGDILMQSPQRNEDEGSYEVSVTMFLPRYEMVNHKTKI